MAAGGRWVIPASGKFVYRGASRFGDEAVVDKRYANNRAFVASTLQGSVAVAGTLGPPRPNLSKIRWWSRSRPAPTHTGLHPVASTFSPPPKKSFFLPASNSTSNPALLAIGRVSSAFPPCKITTEEARTMAPLILHNVPDDELYIGDDGVKRPYAMLFSQLVPPSLLPRPIFHLPPILRHVRS